MNLLGLLLLLAACHRDPNAGRQPLPPPAVEQLTDPLHLSCWKAPGAWPQWMHDPLHTGRSDADFASADLTLAWRFRPSEHVYQYDEGMTVWSSPAAGVVEGRPLVFAGYCDRNLYAVDGATGEKVWEFSPGAHVSATPALAEVDGRALLIAAANNRAVYGLAAATGDRLWLFEAAPWTFTQGESYMSSPTVVNLQGVPTVFLGVWISDRSAARNVQSGEVIALRAKDGSPLWRKRLASVPLTAPVVAHMGSAAVVFVASHHGVVYALRADNGEVLWESPLNEGLRSSVSMGAVGGGAGLFVGTRQHTLFCVDPTTGRRRWRSPASYWIDATPGLLLADGAPAVVAGAYDRQVYAWRGDDGKPLWTATTGNYAYSSPALATVKGQPAVFQMSWDQGLYLFDGKTGVQLWQVASGPLVWSHAFQGDSLWASPAVVKPGERPAVLFPACDGVLYCYH